MNKKLAIFISCSAPNDKPDFPFLYNIYAGSELHNDSFSDMISDNLGENISKENPYYCELTVQYYAWKNFSADYLGFFHSRRYMSFNQQNLVDKTYSKKKLPRAYFVEKLPTRNLLEKHGYDEQKILLLLKNYPVIAALPENMAETARNRFILTQINGRHELELIETKLKMSYPEFLPAFEKYMASKHLYFCNMFVMRKDIFDRYCSWLFDILAYADKNLHERLERDDGMMGEQLFGVFMTYLKEQSSINWAEYPRIHFSEIGGTTNNFSCNKLGNLIFPPGSFRRNILRKIFKRG